MSGFDLSSKSAAVDLCKKADVKYLVLTMCSSTSLPFAG